MAFTSQLSRTGRIYVRAVSILGFLAAGEALFQLLGSPLRPQWILLALLTLISGSASVKLPWAHVSISISEAFVFTAVLLYGPAAGTLTVVLDCLVISFWISKRRPEFERALFNIAAPALSVWCSAHLFFYIAGIPPLGNRAPSLDPTGELGAILPSLVLFAVVYFGLNSWLVAFVIAIEKRETPWQVWRLNFVWLSLNYFCGASVAILLVGYSRTIDLRFVGVVVPLLLVLHFTFKTSTQRVEDANKHVDQLNALYLSTIETLAMAVDAKDQVTHGHIRRVQSQAARLATQIGVQDDKMIKAIQAAALLHDMGKLAVPEYILNKPGKLSPAEFEKMKVHASVGADMLSAIDFPYPVVPIVRHHHENWNGSGYPAGLSGTQIPIGARVLAVVDCFDALTSDRPYRPRLSDEEAFEILLERRGSMYDPLIVDEFIKVNSAGPLRATRNGPPSHVLNKIARSTREQSSAAGLTTGSNVDSGDRTRALYLSETLGRLGNLSSVGEVILGYATSTIPCSLGVFYLYDSKRDELTAARASGIGVSLADNLRIALGQKLSGWVAANRQTIRNSDPMLDLGEGARSDTLRLRSSLSTSIVCRGDLLGVLSLYSDQPDAFTEEHRVAIEGACQQIARGLEAAGLLDKRASAEII